jgi:hypothetical protein
MPITVVDFPAVPECNGTQWSVADEEQLARLTALVLIGRSHIVAKVLQGAQRQPALTSTALRQRLRAQLIVDPGPRLYHRDGLLFEIICWIVAEMTRLPNEVISEPHLSATQQGLDTIKIAFDDQNRDIIRAFVYEQKCTTDPRALFTTQVLPAFRQWLSGVRDNQLLQISIALLQRFSLTDAEATQIYDRLAQDRPLAFKAALTVSPEQYGTAQCVELFTDYMAITALLENRIGDTFPIAAIRPWFQTFAERVWAMIEPGDV